MGGKKNLTAELASVQRWETIGTENSAGRQLEWWAHFNQYSVQMLGLLHGNFHKCEGHCVPSNHAGLCLRAAQFSPSYRELRKS